MNNTQMEKGDQGEDGTYYDAMGTNTNGETNEMMTDMNYAYTEPASEGFQNYNSYNEYYDPGQYQSYYYQDENGNYFTYSDPQQEVANEAAENAGVAPNPMNLVLSYEYEDWEPKSYCWLVDIIVDTFMAKAFLVYLTVLLYCAAVVIASLGLDYTFAIIFRMFSPPDPKGSKDLQAFGYFSMFFYVSFVFVGALCAIMDMARNLWMQKRESTMFWGFSHKVFSKKKPPFMIYFLIFMVTVPLPLLWGLIEAGIKKQSFLFFAQRFANVVVLATVVLVAICYVCFFCRAVMMKRRAVRDRKLKDDFELREKAYKHKENKMAKTHWYHAMTVLEEFGMDGKTLRMNCIVFTVGCVPLFAIYAGTTLSTLTGNPSMAWPAISSVALICVYFVAWLSLLHRKNQWAMYTSFIFIGIQLVLGVVGVAVGQYPASIAIVLVSFVACQGMLTRKRRHALTRKELCDILKIPLNKKIEQQKSKRKVDSYLFCCRDLILDYLKCMDIKSRFGYRHPSVVQAEREYSIKNIALRVDHKALLVWWIIVMLAAAFVVAFGNSVSYQYLSPIATNPHTPVLGEKTDDPICSIVFNENGSAPMTLYDLALLAALSHTFGDNGATDFATWFGSKPDLVRQHPTRLPPTFKFATDGINMTFSDYVDLSSGFHFITLNSNSRGLAVFRDADEWGESIAYQVAGAVSPLISFWPEGNIRDYVVQGAFLKKWFPPSTVLHNVTAYVRDLVEEVGGDKVVIVGDQFNGGYAKLLLSNFTDDNVTFVAFNPPGTKYKTGAIHRGIQLTSVRSAWSFIDSLEDSEQTFFVPCDNSTMSSTRCGRISTAINYISKTCGDSEGRSILDV